jgi:bifunctional UDP-N-acetylglucosamine pyrophosphorylase/glucosamine-1-phosphate N-acetyltransferase
VGIYESPSPDDALVVDRPADFEKAANILRLRKTEALVRLGVMFLDPETAWIDWDSKIGSGTVIYPSVVIEGLTAIGRECRIHPHVHIVNSRIGDGVKILDCTVMDSSVLEAGVQAGPFSRLRPGTIGNFVELKNTDFGPGSKAQHLSYLGDSLVEEGVNVGAGTITCNYDGFRKSRTHIEAGVFIGSGTELVAPVKIGKGAYVAAGSTIGRDVSPGSLAIARARQAEKPGWVLRKLREKKKARKP